MLGFSTCRCRSLGRNEISARMVGMQRAEARSYHVAHPQGRIVRRIQLHLDETHVTFPAAIMCLHQGPDGRSHRPAAGAPRGSPESNEGPPRRRRREQQIVQLRGALHAGRASDEGCATGSSGPWCDVARMNELPPRTGRTGPVRGRGVWCGWCLRRVEAAGKAHWGVVKGAPADAGDRRAAARHLRWRRSARAHEHVRRLWRVSGIGS